MASVFLSYDREDSDRARHFARALENSGHQVWWDLHVRSGAQFSKVIEEALKAADVVVVLWSARSIESAWVRDEAAAGRDTGRLVPVMIDGTEPPLGFRQFQTIDLSNWRGRGRPPAIRTLLDDVASARKSPGGEAPAERPTARPRARDRRRWPLVVAALGGAVVAMTAALLAWHPWSSAAGVPTVLVGAARNDSASQEIAGDLAVQLGRLRTVQSGSLRLVTSADRQSGKPQLLLQATGLSDGPSRGANVVLKNTADGAVVWSQDFEQGARKLSDMKLQMALTASHVLDCASEAIADNDKRLPRRSLTHFLTSCGQGAEGIAYDPQAVISGLSKVVVDAPRFTPAWRKLLIAQADVIDEETDPDALASEREALRRSIAAATRLEPDMPEARIAEMSLVPKSDLVTRLRLIDEAYRAAPKNPLVLRRRTLALQTVGRMSEALRTAYDAMNVDPTSPSVLDNFVSALMYSGQVELAERQLERAQRLWPGTTTLDELEWRFYLRFGDPEIGLRITSEQTVGPSLLLFIQARANPTKENVAKLFAYYASRLHDPAKLPSLNILMQAYGQFHRENELYEIMLHWPKPEEFDDLQDGWFRPALHEFRRDPRFMQVAARSPLLRYWRTTGKWPDFCSEPGVPYDCRKEAARLGA